MFETEKKYNSQYNLTNKEIKVTIFSNYFNKFNFTFTLIFNLKFIFKAWTS